MSATIVFNCDDTKGFQTIFGHFKPLFEIQNIKCENVENIQTSIKARHYLTNVIVEEIGILSRLVRKDWIFIQNTALNNMTTYDEIKKIRSELNQCMREITCCIKQCDPDTLKDQYLLKTFIELKKLTAIIIPLRTLEDSLYMKLSHYSEKCIVYQYFHTFLDVQYYSLLLYHLCGGIQEFNSFLKQLTIDLILFSSKSYKQKQKNVFLCNCHKSFWLFIQILTERLLGEECFWPLFGEGVKNQESSFTLWLLNDVAGLQTIDLNGKDVGSLCERVKPNFMLLESSVKSVLSNGEFTVQVAKSLESLLTNIWLKSGRIEVYQMLWEYFSKRLNISTREDINLAMVNLVEIIDTILWTPGDCEGEFEMFLGFLSNHLNEHPHHWRQIKRSIFSQLGPNKMKDLSDVGFFHALLLLISLTKVSFNELCKRFAIFVDHLPVQRKQTPLIWTFYSSLMVRHVRENRSIELVTPSFSKMIEEASTDNNHFHLIKIFIGDFENIIRFSTNLQLHQWLLLGTWTHKYMSTCYHSDLIAFLEVLLSTLERINTDQVWCEWESSFKNHIYPTLKSISSTLSAPEQIGILSAKIAKLCPSLLSDAFMFFNSDTIAPRVSSNFLCVILDDYPNSLISPQQEILALQVWVKTCLLTKDRYEELTRSIVKLDILPTFIKKEITGVRDPLSAFLDALGVNVKQNLQNASLNNLCEMCFGPAEKWITQYLSQPDNEGIVMRIYTIIAVAFYKIGPLLYNRHKSSCAFARLVPSILLPTEMMIGKALHAYRLQAIKKTWQLYFNAIIKINTPSDTFIERILRDLVVKYVPHFSIVDSPMLKCLDDDTISQVILDKMSNAFFKHPTKEAESNIFKSLRIINDFVQATTSLSAIKLVVTKTLFGLFEVVMFHNQRNMALAVVKTIVSSPLYLHVKKDFEVVIIDITEKYLALNAANCFQLMGLLVKFIPGDLKRLTPMIKQQVINVEKMRGVGFDKNLRLNLERLEKSLL